MAPNLSPTSYPRDRAAEGSYKARGSPWGRQLIRQFGGQFQRPNGLSRIAQARRSPRAGSTLGPSALRAEAGLT